MRFSLPRLRLLATACAIAAVPTAFAQASANGAPTFSNYAGPSDMVGDAGEPSIGFNPKSDATMFQAYPTPAKVTGFDGAGHAPWTDVTEPTALVSLDPILWTDRDPGRAIPSQLLVPCAGG